MAGLTLYEKLDQIENRYMEMTTELSSPEVHADSANFQKLARRHAELSEMVEKYREWKQIDKDLAGARQMQLEAEDPEMKQLAQDEEKQLAERKGAIEGQLKILLLPSDPNDEKNVIVEIRAGTWRATKPLCLPVALPACYSRWCRIAALESGDTGKLTQFAGRPERSRGFDPGAKSVLEIEI